MSATSYAELVAQAETAVAAVKDEALKRIAFQRVLDDLLGRSDANSAQRGVPARKLAKLKKAVPTSTAKSGPKSYVEELVSEGFFKTPKTITQVKDELENVGHHIPVTSLSGPLQKLCQQKILRRQKQPTTGTFVYSVW
jgi:hypothetical protein